MFPRIIPIARVTGLQECRVCVENREAEVVLISRAGTQRTIRALNMNKHDNCVQKDTIKLNECDKLKMRWNGGTVLDNCQRTSWAAGREVEYEEYRTSQARNVMDDWVNNQQWWWSWGFDEMMIRWESE